MMSFRSWGNHLMAFRYQLVVSLNPYRFCSFASEGNALGSSGSLVSNSVIGPVSGA